MERECMSTTEWVVKYTAKSWLSAALKVGCRDTQLKGTCVLATIRRQTCRKRQRLSRRQVGRPLETCQLGARQPLEPLYQSDSYLI